MVTTTTAIEVVGLTKYYGRHRGVEDVALGVQYGEILGFLGPNGSGKTTVLRVVMGLLRATSGEVVVDGSPVDSDPREWRRSIGYLPGELELYDHLTVNDYLSYLAHIRRIDCSTDIDVLSKRFDLDRSARIAGLSKGNKQKVGVVQAFMHRPTILLLDEPTSGLDPIAQEEFADLIRQRRDEGAAVVLSSHVLHEVEQVADRVAILDHGRLLTVDTVDGLRARIATEINLTFDRPVDLEKYASCPGVVDACLDDDCVVVRAVVPHTEVLRRAVDDGVVKVVSHEPTLADVFIALTRSNHVS